MDSSTIGWLLENLLYLSFYYDVNFNFIEIFNLIFLNFSFFENEQFELIFYEMLDLLKFIKVSEYFYYCWIKIFI